MEELAHKMPHQAESGIAGQSAATVRIRIDLSYDGSGFSGWAAQPGRRTVESVLAETLGQVLREHALHRPAARLRRPARKSRPVIGKINSYPNGRG